MEDILVKLGYLAGATRFRRISEKMYLDGDRLYSDAGINFKASWFSVYYILSKEKKPLKVTEIAEQIGFTHITVKSILLQLEKEGLVIIVLNPNDRRSKLASLTLLGEKLKDKLEPLWVSISDALKNVFVSGHPDILNILNRIENELLKTPVYKRVLNPKNDTIDILDYKPSLKNYFNQLAGPWQLSILNGKLTEEEKFSLDNPGKAYIENGGFVFFAKYMNEIVGCVALKRMDEETFEMTNLFTHPNYRNLGVGTKLIERSISRCKENKIKKLWLQSGITSQKAKDFFLGLGFIESEPHKQMKTTAGIKIIMRIDL